MPHRLLQFMPEIWRRGYLLRHSGGENAAKVFNLAQHLKKHKKIQVIWPDKAGEILLAYSSIKNLQEAESPEISWNHFVEAENLELVAGLFPGEPAIPWRKSESAWHDASLQASLAAIRAFSPDTVVNLMRPCPPVLRAVMNGSGAEMRIGVDEECPWPYANVRLQNTRATTLAGRFFQILDPWRYSGFSIQERWERILPGAGQMAAAVEKWRIAGAAPESTWLYLHEMVNPIQPLDEGLHALLIQRLQAFEGGEFNLGVVAWNPTALPLEKTGAWSKVTVLNAANPSELLGILDASRGVAAVPGFGLQFASLTEVRAIGLLKKDQAEYDISTWNSLFRAEWV